MAGFGKKSGPSVPPKSQTLFGTINPSPSPPLISKQSWGIAVSHFENSQVLKQTQSPNLGLEGSQSATQGFLSSPLLQDQSSDASPIMLVAAKYSPHNLLTSASHSNPDYLQGDRSLSPSRPVNHQASKRTRSSPQRNSNKDSLPASNFEEPDSERETRAKAKCLTRFSAELSQPVEGLQDSRWCRSTDTNHTPSKVDSKKVSGNESGNVVGDARDGYLSLDHESKESSAIVGLCEDMCPESEREERQRKGNLDQYETLGWREKPNKQISCREKVH